MTRRQLIDLCLTFPGAYEDYPFDENWAVIRHGAGKKIFACIYDKNGGLYINLKCEPMRAEFWREVYKGVTPGFHMNKTHWNTVELNADVPRYDLLAMIGESHALTKPKRRLKRESRTQ